MRLKISNLVFARAICINKLRRIADDNIETAVLGHDWVELGVPVEWLGVVQPLGFLLARLLIVELIVKKCANCRKALLDLSLGLDKGLVVGIEIELLIAEVLEGHRHLLQLVVDLALQLRPGEHVAVGKSVLDLLFGRIADKRVAAFDVEVDVRQGIETEVLVVGIDIHNRHHLQEKTQPGDFRRLVHDVHAVEIAEDDVLVDEVLLIRAELVLDLRQLVLEELGVVAMEIPHSVEANLIQRLKDVERGKQERAGSARRIQNRHLAQRLIEVRNEVVVLGLA